MYKKLFLILLLLNVMPVIYHNVYIGTVVVKACDGATSEQQEDGCPEDCTPDVETTYGDVYISGTAQYQDVTTTTTDPCSGTSSSTTSTVLVDNCTDPAYLSETIGDDPHDYYISNDSVYATVTVTTNNTCNNITSTQDRVVSQPDLSEILGDYNAEFNGLHDHTASGTDPQFKIGATYGNPTISCPVLATTISATFSWSKSGNTINISGYDCALTGLRPCLSLTFKSASPFSITGSSMITFSETATLDFGVIIPYTFPLLSKLVFIDGTYDTTNGKYTVHVHTGSSNVAP